jgi:diguanylate cyclase (GGDEF)-like protein/PAS domain S-box-containing protein
MSDALLAAMNGNLPPAASGSILPLPPPAILLADDDASKRLALRAIIEPLGHSIVDADSGRAALRAVLRQRFALILMDVRMPTMDGYETAKLIRQREESALTPIIFVSAFGRDEVETADAYASGAVDFVFAPVLPDVLRAKVTVFVDLFVANQELQSSLDAITHLNATVRDSGLRTQAVLDNVSDGIFILDENGLIESVNRAVAGLFDYAPNQVIGRPFAFMIADAGQAEGAGSSTSAGLPVPGRAVSTLGRRRDSSTFPVEVEHGRMVHADRAFTLTVVRDVSERHAHTAALEHQALHDGLTGLANRTLFGHHVVQALAAAERAAEPRSVLVMDLDGFKQVNDSLGHDQGDTLLKDVAGRLQTVLRSADTVARLGGDEFAVLPAGPTDLVAAAAVAWKIQQACEPPFMIGDELVRVAASVGIALYPEHGTNASDLLRRADLAMYEAKRTRTAHAVFDAAQEQELARHLALLSDLRHCITRDELVLHYQPKIDLTTREICGVEALIRWCHPTLGLLAPGSFMPEVERIELIEPITRWVLDEALRQQRAWSDGGLQLTVAVNIAAASLQCVSDLPDTVGELISKWGGAADRLTLELTERALVETCAPDVLNGLHAMGVNVSIDDYGTGYASLAYLQRLPVDELKVDKSFVTDLVTGGDDAVIVRSTIELAHNLGLHVVAEGVEDANVLEMLTEYGCDSAQGFFFSRPCRPAELEAWLADSAYAARPSAPEIRRTGLRHAAAGGVAANPERLEA